MPQPYRHQRSQESVTDEKVDDVAVRNRQRQNTDQRQDHEEDSDGADRDAHGARKDRVPPQGMQQHHGAVNGRADQNPEIVPLGHDTYALTRWAENRIHAQHRETENAGA